MESRVQNPKGTVRTMSNVLRTNQLPCHLPTNHESHVQRNEDALPNGTIRLHGQYPYRHEQRLNTPPRNRPPSPRQTRREILLPLTHQMQVRKRKGQLPGSRHQLRKDPYRPHQSRRAEELATEARHPETSTINARDTRLPKTIHPGLRPHCTTAHQPPEKGDNLPMDKHTQQSRRKTDRHHP